MITPHCNAIGIDHMFFDKYRHARGTATHINASRPQLLLIFNKA